MFVADNMISLVLVWQQKTWFCTTSAQVALFRFHMFSDTFHIVVLSDLRLQEIVCVEPARTHKRSVNLFKPVYETAERGSGCWVH